MREPHRREASPWHCRSLRRCRPPILPAYLIEVWRREGSRLRFVASRWGHGSRAWARGRLDEGLDEERLHSERRDAGWGAVYSTWSHSRAKRTDSSLNGGGGTCWPCAYVQTRPTGWVTGSRARARSQHRLDAPLPSDLSPPPTPSNHWTSPFPSSTITASSPTG